MDWTGKDPVLRLRSLLGPEPETPWAALIPQLLLWSFRRFCIQHLKNLEDNRLLDFLWETQLDLAQNYSPPGLQNVVNTWMTPENMAQLFSSPEDYNQFFIEVIQAVDVAISTNNDALEDTISDFLDVKIRTVLLEWLTGPSRAFFIFPMNEDQSNHFTHTQFLSLVRVLLDYSTRRRTLNPTAILTRASHEERVMQPPSEMVMPQRPATPEIQQAPEVQQAAATEVQQAAATEVQQAAATEPQKPPEVQQAAAPEVKETQAPPPPQQPISLKQAVAQRRQTLRAHGRRGLPVTPTSAPRLATAHHYTRRIKPAGTLNPK